MAGPRSPGLLHYLHKVVGCFVSRSGSSFLVPDPRSGSSFWILVPVPRSGSSFLVPDVTCRFITLSMYVQSFMKIHHILRCVINGTKLCVQIKQNASVTTLKVAAQYRFWAPLVAILIYLPWARESSREESTGRVVWLPPWGWGGWAPDGAPC